jgi:hypothetical protein
MTLYVQPRSFCTTGDRVDTVYAIFANISLSLVVVFDTQQEVADVAADKSAAAEGKDVKK